MVLAVIVLHEPCTALQMIGGVLILAGSLITQRQPARAAAAAARREVRRPAPLFVPRYLAGYLFASVAAAVPTARRRSWRALRSSTPGRRPASSAG